MEFEFIDEGDIEAVKRGRKTTVPAELVELLKRVPAGKAVRLAEYKLDTKVESYKSDKASVSATIRSAGEQAGVKVSIRWSPDGIPQLLVQKPKASTKSK